MNEQDFAEFLTNFLTSVYKLNLLLVLRKKIEYCVVLYFYDVLCWTGHLNPYYNWKHNIVYLIFTTNSTVPKTDFIPLIDSVIIVANLPISRFVLMQRPEKVSRRVTSNLPHLAEQSSVSPPFTRGPWLVGATTPSPSPLPPSASTVLRALRAAPTFH